MDVIAELPQRRGDRPTTTTTFPHKQLDQQPDDPTVRDELARRATALEGVVVRDSVISVPGARALVVADHRSVGPDAAFLRGREFAHFHPDPDWSLHLALPDPVADIAIDRGWAELHLIARTEELPGSVVMVYAPRDGDEAEAVWTLLRASHEFATGA